MRTPHQIVDGCVVESCPGGPSRPMETDPPATASQIPQSTRSGPRVTVSGKLFQLSGSHWPLKGMTYGPFAPNAAGVFLPERARLLADLSHMRQLGTNCIRLYHAPDEQFLDDALAEDLRVFVDVPWEKHRCFFEDYRAQQEALECVTHTARQLGHHSATFAISVANEFPTDIVRFYGANRLERFLEDLIDAAKQEAPQCLVTFANYPSTEFLHPRRLDFTCFNVYLEARANFCQYLRRLQHIADGTPLVLGESGMDSMRWGQRKQAKALMSQVRDVFRTGLAGSFVFAYTDDWFTGGFQVEKWAFGVTDRDRQEKLSARGLQRAWRKAHSPDRACRPRVSVVVCSYNGARTLAACLRSLAAQNYPDFEVILVDDGSTDDTSIIAERFPEVRYIRQTNLGLSVARNVGAQAATGQIVAYTDSDCVADPHWLFYLVRSMRQQKVGAIGGPNVPPPADCWTARCVAASPGGPSHVMFDDQFAEHVPGCNMAFNRELLLSLGGFDPQFRQAGDDVDICWRFSDAGFLIGYAPSALVWHYRRNTVAAYFKQQKGYGRAEAMLYFKHPDRFDSLGSALWNGVIYGEGAVGLLTLLPAVYHGRFGSAPFQMIYRRNVYSIWSYFTLMEWHILVVLILMLSVLAPKLALVAATMWTLTAVSIILSLRRVRLPKDAPWWCRPLVAVMHLAQPVVRAWHRYRTRLPGSPRAVQTRAPSDHVKRISPDERDLYWESTDGRGREALLEITQSEANRLSWRGLFGQAWSTWDMAFPADPWVEARVWTASEELGGMRRFTRARCKALASPIAMMAMFSCLVWGTTALVTHQTVSGLLGSIVTLALLLRLVIARRRSLDLVTGLLWHAGQKAQLEPVRIRRHRAAGGRSAQSQSQSQPESQLQSESNSHSLENQVT